MSNPFKKLSSLRLLLSVKTSDDQGMGSALSSDSGGTTVTFNKTFISITSITVSPQATTAVISVYDFSGDPFETEMKVLFFNTAGTRVSCDFSWQVTGFESPE